MSSRGFVDGLLGSGDLAIGRGEQFRYHRRRMSAIGSSVDPSFALPRLHPGILAMSQPIAERRADEVSPAGAKKDR